MICVAGIFGFPFAFFIIYFYFIFFFFIFNFIFCFCEFFFFNTASVSFDDAQWRANSRLMFIFMLRTRVTLNYPAAWFVETEEQSTPSRQPHAFASKIQLTPQRANLKLASGTSRLTHALTTEPSICCAQNATLHNPTFSTTLLYSHRTHILPKKRVANRLVWKNYKYLYSCHF